MGWRQAFRFNAPQNPEKQIAALLVVRKQQKLGLRWAAWPGLCAGCGLSGPPGSARVPRHHLLLPRHHCCRLPPPLQTVGAKTIAKEGVPRNL